MSQATRFNPTGLQTLFLKEVRRFTKVWKQTVFSPLVTTSLYFLVFGVALGSRLKNIDGVPYIQFVIPGLMMLSMISNAFLNTSSSFFQSKINGTVVDLLVAPLGAAEILLAYVAAATVRAFIVGTLVYLVASAFTGFHMVHPLWALFFALGVSVTFAHLGLISAIFATKFDELSLLPNFILTPLTFLGGVFYSVSMLPAPWDTVSHFNPIFYMVNGLRYGLLGISDVSVYGAAGFLLGLLVLVVSVASIVVSRGHRLRA